MNNTDPIIIIRQSLVIITPTAGVQVDCLFITSPTIVLMQSPTTGLIIATSSDQWDLLSDFAKKLASLLLTIIVMHPYY